MSITCAILFKQVGSSEFVKLVKFMYAMTMTFLHKVVCNGE